MNLNKATAMSLETVAEIEVNINNALGRGTKARTRPSNEEKLEAVRRVHRGLRAKIKASKT